MCDVVQALSSFFFFFIQNKGKGSEKVSKRVVRKAGEAEEGRRRKLKETKG